MSKTDYKKSNFKILIVDDSNLSVNLITEVLSDEGFTSIEHTTNPGEGFQLAQASDYHLHILDVVMPKISGLEIAKEISQKDNPGCILMMSSLDSENILIESIASGAKDFLLKPFTNSQLIDSVNKLYQLTLDERVF